MPYVINKLYDFKVNKYYINYNLINNKMKLITNNENNEVIEDGKKYIIISQKVNECLIDWLIPLEE